MRKPHIPTLVRCATTTAATPGKVKVTFSTAAKNTVEVLAPVGLSLMEAARDYAKLDIEAACDGTCACSTCHVFIDAEYFSKLPRVTEDEQDMLDLAPDLRPTSRLSCQVKLTAELDGIRVQLPSATSNQLTK